tara:strand:+ start:1761 stop:2132 length:372 start_codon:yes stop_codon:yes gene_type:complete
MIMIKIENTTTNVVQITVPETLKANDFSDVSVKVDALIQKHGKIKLLLNASQFNGWDNISAFEKHMAFVKSHHNSIERAAVITGHIWQHWVVGVLKIFIHPEIRVFDENEFDQAQEWISEDKI